jgi:nucleoside 2-deoxyribosyltransferase
MRVYLAGPEVFLKDAQTILRHKVDMCKGYGLTGLTPFDGVLDADVDEPPDVLAAKIYEANVGLIDSCEVLIANMTPWRGPSADVGTVWETGYATARGKAVFCYTNTSVPFALRTEMFKRVLPDTHTVEDFGLAENLMPFFGGLRWFTRDVPSEALWTDLGSFEAALAAAAQSPS